MSRFNMSDGFLFTVYKDTDVDKMFVDINATVHTITMLQQGTINFLIMCRMACARKVLSEVNIFVMSMNHIEVLKLVAIRSIRIIICLFSDRESTLH